MSLVSLVGRYAGRMRNATFMLDGVTHHVTANENNGADSLHGGTIGYDQRNWTIVAANETAITFSLFDDAFEGYPGQIVTYAMFSVGLGPSLTSRLVSVPVDRPTPIMLTTHPYFNLNAFLDPAAFQHVTSSWTSRIPGLSAPALMPASNSAVSTVPE